MVYGAVDEAVDALTMGCCMTFNNFLFVQRLLADVRGGKIDLIVFTKLDRWFRNIAEYYGFCGPPGLLNRTGGKKTLKKTGYRRFRLRVLDDLLPLNLIAGGNLAGTWLLALLLGCKYRQVAGRYVDAGISARKPASKRPELQRLLADVGSAGGGFYASFSMSARRGTLLPTVHQAAFLRHNAFCTKLYVAQRLKMAYNKKWGGVYFGGTQS